MKIGILPALTPTAGGIYQYSLAVIRALHEWHQSEDTETEFLVFLSDHSHTSGLPERESGWGWVYLPPSRAHYFKRLFRRLGGRPALRMYQLLIVNRRHKRLDPAAIRKRPELSAFLSALKVDLMVYPAPSTISFEVETPFIMAVHDLQHRIQPEFPEVSRGGEWQLREYLFRNGMRNALRILVDSEVGRQDVLEHYGQYGDVAERIRVLPFLPATYLKEVDSNQVQQMKNRFGLPDEYLFYPAQFWPHKNHLRVIEAIHHLRSGYGYTPSLVLVGSHNDRIRTETYREVRKTWKRLGLSESVHDLGQVSDETMASLYASAKALIFPTFFGPTNIPILEAWAFGCPVITSDIRGISDQVEDAAILVDPRSTLSIAEGIHRLWTDSALQRQLAERGRARLAAYTPEDFKKRLIGVMEEAKQLTRISHG